MQSRSVVVSEAIALAAAGPHQGSTGAGVQEVIWWCRRSLVARNNISAYQSSCSTASVPCLVATWLLGVGKRRW